MLVNLPTASTTLMALSESATPMFNEFLPIVTVFIGMLIGGLLIPFIIIVFIATLNRIRFNHMSIDEYDDWTKKHNYFED